MRKNLYWAVFCLNFTLALSAYINSLFVEKYFGLRAVGPVYVLASLLMLFGLSLIPEILARSPRGLRLFTSLFLGLKIVAGLALIYLRAPLPLLLVLLGFEALGHLISFNFDLYLEHTTKNSETGRVRGSFLTLVNTAWVIAPLLVGLLLGQDENYKIIYLISSLALLPALYLTLTTKRVLTRNPPGQFFSILFKILRHRSNHYREIYLILIIDLLLNFFYALMVIYLPLHLHNTVGFAWPTIGLILTIMLLPFVIVTYPLGWLADRKWGEKETMALGFIGTGVATLFIPHLAVTNILIWAMVLFATRVGAATIEIMKETYLFKKINAKDVEILSVSRNLRPIAYLLAPLIGGLLLQFYSSATIFTALGVVTLIGIIPTLALRDTR